jgi:hypothetical protein
VEEVEVDITLTGQVPAWRPETGHWRFGEEGERFFAWLPSVPQGGVEATYRVGGVSHTVTGVGYHDHNWGSAPMPDLMHHWYWARGAAGPYSVITSYITAEKRYGYAALPVFMLTRDGELIADDGGKVSFQELGRHTDTATGKPVGNLTRYIYTDGEERYVVSSPGTPTLPRTSSSTPSRAPEAGRQARRVRRRLPAVRRRAAHRALQGRPPGGQSHRRRAVGADVLREGWALQIGMLMNGEL